MNATQGGDAGRPAAGVDHHPEIDWVAAEASPEFQELVKRKRSFVIPATLFFLAWFFGFIVLTAYAPDFMGESVIEGLTVGYCLALTQFIMVWALAAWYLRRADRVFDPLARRASEHALKAGTAAEGGAAPTGRFERPAAGEGGEPTSRPGEEVSGR